MSYILIQWIWTNVKIFTDTETFKTIQKVAISLLNSTIDNIDPFCVCLVYRVMIAIVIIWIKEVKLSFWLSFLCKSISYFDLICVVMSEFFLVAELTGVVIVGMFAEHRNHLLTVFALHPLLIWRFIHVHWLHFSIKINDHVLILF